MNWIWFAVIIALLVGVTERVFVESVFVKTPAMRPTIEKGEHVLVRKFAYKTPELYDIVILRKTVHRDRGPKRIVALPGQCVRLVDSWQVVVNGRIVPSQNAFPDDNRTEAELTRNERYMSAAEVEAADPGEPTTMESKVILIANRGRLPGPVFPDRPRVLIEDGSHRIQLQRNPAFWYVTRYGDRPVCLARDEYFVLGDNRYASSDSREYGPVKLSDIQGKVSLIWLSTDPVSNETRFDRIGIFVK